MSGNEDNLLQSIQEEMLTLRQMEVGIRLEISPEQAFAVAAFVQLALRHPNAGGSGADLARSVVDQIQQKFLIFPAISAALAKGWEQE